MQRRLQSSILATVMLVLAAPALAHTGIGPAAGLPAGLLHPLTGIDHLLAMVAVGLLAALSSPQAILLLLTFPAIMALGALLGVMGITLPATEMFIAASTVILAGLAAVGCRLSLKLLLPLVAFFAFFHGLAHGAEMPSDGSGLLYALGFVSTTAALHAVGLGVGRGLMRTLGVTFARAAALALAGAGLPLVIAAI